MLSDARLSALLLQMYGCAARPNEWPGLLAHLSDLFHAPQSVLIHHQAADGVVSVAAISHGGDPESMTAYNTHFGKCDPWAEAYRRQGGFARGAVDVVPSEALVPESAFQRTEFYADFGRRFDIARNVNVVTVPEGGDSTTTLGLLRGARQPGYGAAEIDALRLIAPHLQQALLLSRTLASAERRVAELIAALDGPAEPMALLAPDGTVVFLNGAMRDLTAPGQALEIDRRCLRFRSAKSNTVFRTALDAFSRWQQGLLAPAATSIPFGAETTGGRRTLTLLPVARSDAPGSYLVVVRVNDPAAAREQRLTATLAAWDLTPAEARMARLLANGRTVAEIASDTRTRQATVRWHLKQVFAKTGTRTQSQLVALLHM